MPPPPSMWQRRWPGPAGGAPQAVLAATAVAAVIAAVSIPLDRAGVGWLVAVVAGTVSLGIAAFSRATTSLPSPAKASATHPSPAEASATEASGLAANAANPVRAGQSAPSPDRASQNAVRPSPVPAGSAVGKPAEPGPAGVPAGPAGVPAGGVGVGGPDPVRSGNTGMPDRTASAGAGRVGRAPLGVTRLVWLAATVALVGVGTVRAAGWLFVLCLLTAGLTACLAVANGRTLSGLFFSVVIAPEAFFRSVPWARRGLRQADRTGRSSLSRGFATAGVSVGLLVVFGALFASADAAFADLIDGLLPEFSAGTVFRWIFVGLAVGGGLLGAAYVLAAPPDLTGLERPSRHRLRGTEWAVPVALLDVLFAAFVLVQLTNLFGGSAHVQDTAGLTYADHARGGFWQLLAVTLLTLMVIAGAIRWAPRDTPAQRWLIRGLLGVLALFSLVVVASALYRMNVYTHAYGATRLRLLVAACELWLGAIFVLILAAGVRLRATWLPRVVVGTAVLALLGLAVANPDRLIAERNVDRHATSGRVDLDYLSRLSADAVPALDKLPGPLRDCALREIAQNLTDHPDDWRGANLGRSTAWKLLRADPVVGPGQQYGTCSGASRPTS
ncbi:DUF4153 domain-containing protein [Micromonospora sp. NBC_01796]|uniref:DUF4153 domain-containing protein n=1 Tax=Micromonospora sp. NBC_01796 TaxID=2975987 RepID=UPI002DD9F3E5|nr:DUF4153 domain-containing protein [Micromonospora sp. NBC_01796]WSA88460.1 DUF4173 domain-containing protein [Micromonospora sp. NBC_01796]